MWTALTFLFLVSAASTSPLPQAENGTVTVKTEAGLLRGKVATSIWNRTYYSFEAVPFAQPPTGELRFKSPQPVKPWTGVKDALNQGPYCPQGKLTTTTAKMSEDCLYLNVYIPQVASGFPTKGLSVLVWVHGGGFVYGSGIRDLYGPDNMMNSTAILVTMNYRLGALGFLTMENREMTSNAGMKDQVAALRWVKANIASFGGNPDDVTVFGESAGGMSVELLLLSPMTEGLFHRAISESGSAVTIGSNPKYNGTQAVFRLGEVLGYNKTDADGLVKFLRSLPAEDIVKGQSLASAALGGSMTLSTFPAVDAKVQEGKEVFLPDIPEKLLRAGKSRPIPYITGCNSKEMKMIEEGLTAAALKNYNDNPELFIPSTLHITKNTTESLQLAAKIKSFYFGNKTVSFETLNELVDLLSDNFMIYSVHRSINLHVNYGSSPLYAYLFTYDGTLRIQLGNYTTKGPGHADEMAYLFFISYVPYSPTKDDMEVIRHFTNMWVDYAETGNPSDHESVKWIPATKTSNNYLEIDVKLSLRQDMLKERMAFWDNVYATYNKP